MKITTQELIDLIGDVLEVDSRKLSINSGAEDIVEWDSLGHLGILTKLDEILNGEASSIRELAEVDSIKKIVFVLKNASLHSD